MSSYSFPSVGSGTKVFRMSFFESMPHIPLIRQGTTLIFQYHLPLGSSTEKPSYISRWYWNINTLWEETSALDYNIILNAIKVHKRTWTRSWNWWISHPLKSMASGHLKKMQLDVGREPTLSQHLFSAYSFTAVFKYFRSSIFSQVHTDGQTESDAYEPTVQNAQVGSKKGDSSCTYR